MFVCVQVRGSVCIYEWSLPLHVYVRGNRGLSLGSACLFWTNCYLSAMIRAVFSYWPLNQLLINTDYHVAMELSEFEQQFKNKM